MFRIAAKDLAVDLGTATTLVYARGRGIVVNEPSIIAVRQQGRQKHPIAYGAEAKAMLGRTPDGVAVVRPVRNGAIADFEAAGMMLNRFLKTALRPRSLVKPNIIVSVQSGISEIEKRAIRDSVEGSASVGLLDQPMAAAIGAGLPVMEPRASMIVDIGGGTTDVAVISLGQIVCTQTVRQGGDAMDEAIMNYMRRHHQFLVGETTAETVKKTIGSAHEKFDNQEMEVRGRSVTKGAPATTMISAAEVREAISEVVAAVIATVWHALEITPPELAGDVMSSGVTLVGGGALLRGLDTRLHEELDVDIRIAEDPIGAVVIGAGKCLEKELSSIAAY